MSQWKHSDKSNYHVYKLIFDGDDIVLDSVNADKIYGFGAAKQVASIKVCNGKRVRFTADLSTNNLDGHGAALWLTAAGVGWHVTDGVLGDSFIAGTSEWRTLSYVIDVPPDTTYISYGMMVGGRGEARMRNPKFEIVDESVPATGKLIWDVIGPDSYRKRQASSK